MLAGSGLLRYRAYIVRNAWDELRHRYAGTALGIVWNVVVPLAQILVYAVVFTQIMVIRMPTNLSKNAFVVYLCAGFFPWLAFMECVVRGGQAFVDHANLLKRLAIPEEVFVAQAALASTFSLMLSIVLLFVAALFLGHPPSVTWLLVPVACLLFQLFGFGLGLILSCLNIFFRDIAQLVPIAFQIWMWATPVVYVESILPDAYRAFLPANPAWPYLTAVHDLMVYGTMPSLGIWAAMVAWAVVALFVGSLTVRKLRLEIRDVV